MSDFTIIIIVIVITIGVVQVVKEITRLKKKTTKRKI